MSLIDRLRQPEYTGENRCTPCTTVNIAIAAGASVLAAVASTVLGAGVFTLSLGTIYLRGYLVPGTPTLTKRYFPERVLGRFEKDSTTPVADETVEIDPEGVLLDAHAVEPCGESTDLCLTADFQQAWRESIHTARTHDLGEDHLADMLDISTTDDQITVDQHGEAFVVRTDDAVVGQWSSQAAAVADVAAATELNERLSRWQNLAPAEIARVLMSLRIFIEQCPDCDGPVQVEQDAIESCCRSYDVIISACQDCDCRLFEMEWDDTDADDGQEQPNQSTQATA
ncbi:hypothetical protein [Halococcus saccharolyticus]|uniref:Uncharacterized protein n=1 Tax=Halococcus saccharolyticus DSM 5350 TaxID=1227455 RepID=M0MD84_9EURY|nr:hypothetical protein [Halococcus saccharolyticus]EMA43732.1 hypothetical protein C449_12972 [Halococcus saccharolyticus DSM 5350]